MVAAEALEGDAGTRLSTDRPASVRPVDEKRPLELASSTKAGNETKRSQGLRDLSESRTPSPPHQQEAKAKAKQPAPRSPSPGAAGPRNERKRNQGAADTQRRPWWAPLSEQEQERALRWRAMRLFAELVRLAGTTLAEVMNNAGVSGGSATQTWVEGPIPGRIERFPASFQAVMKWLAAPADAALLEVLSNRRVQARLARLYRGYRKEIKVRRGVSPEAELAADVARTLYGRRNATNYTDRLAGELASWLKEPARHPLHAATLHALLLPLLGWEAYRQVHAPRAKRRR